MKTIINSVFVLIFLSSGVLSAQSDTVPKADAEDEIYTIVENQPEFTGGDNAMIKYLQDNIHYPMEARTRKIEGTVFINFVVETDGRITNAKVLRGIGGGCDEEALRVVKHMPKWIPGRQGGVPVRVYYNIPVRFTF